MYLPISFREDNPETLHELIRQNNFGILVTQRDGAPFATHLPFLLDSSRGPHGTLIAHLARANPQWRDFGGGEALTIFQGPHAYITPSWYESMPSVPTWNYAVVHAYGIPRIVEDRDELYGMLERLVVNHESPRPQPWPMDLSDEYMDRMMRAVVGFEIEITRIEGKFKLSQNRSATDQQRVADELANSETPLDQAVAELMRAEQVPTV
ncbi:MAG TPA: FMN-binding negative transcriptional regulator [Roseiflexaceae bacterium]|nr:FMN-binding negative transcriptional regulator [Roseiflexaceae bacterium]